MHYERHQLSMGAYTITNDDPNQNLELYWKRLELCDAWQQKGQLGVTIYNIPKPKPLIFDFKIPSFETEYPTPRLGDIWIPFTNITGQCYVRIYMPSMEGLFRVGDRIIRIEHVIILSRMLNWKLNLENSWVRKMLETIDFVMGLGRKFLCSSYAIKITMTRI